MYNIVANNNVRGGGELYYMDHIAVVKSVTLHINADDIYNICHL